MILIVPMVGSIWTIIKDISAGVGRLYRKPKLQVCFIPSETFHIASDLSFNGIRGLFLHVIVKNLGKGKANQCRGMLARVLTRNESGQFVTIRDFRNPVELHWAHEPMNCYVKDIEAADQARLDVCFVHEGIPVLHFFCDKRPRGIQTDFPPGRYLIEIVVRAANTAQEKGEFEIDWGGSFDSLSMQTRAFPNDYPLQFEV